MENGSHLAEDASRHPLKRYRRYLQTLLVAVGLACLTILTTYPLSLHFGDSIYGYPEDSFGTIWQLWRYRNALTNGWPWNEAEFIGSPFGVSLGTGLPQPIHCAGLVLTLLSNEVVAYNWLVMLGFWLSAFSAYLLVRALWQNEWAGLLAGVLYGFCPYLTWRATQHISLAHAEWIPLYLLSLFYLSRRKNLRSTLLCGIALATVLVFNYYYGYFMAVATAAFLASKGAYALRRRGSSLDWKHAGLYLWAILLAALLSLPWTWPTLRTVLVEHPLSPFGQSEQHDLAWRSDEVPAIVRAVNRPYSHLFALSARPWDYFLPAIDHPLFGGFSQAAYDSIEGWDLGVSNYGIPNLQANWLSKSAYPHERPVYLGYTALALAAFGLRAAFGRRKWAANDGDRFALLFFVILFAVAVWFSMPPVIPIGELAQNWWPSFPDWQLPTPSYFLYRVLPMFRCYVRFGIVAILSIAVLAGFGMRELLQAIRNKWTKAGAVALIFVLVIFEFLHLPHHTRFPTIPEEYEWLAKQPGDFVIVEYPQSYNYELFYQRIHHKRMLNSHGIQPLVGEVIWPRIEDLSDPATVERLGALGIRYVLLHTADYFGPNPSWDHQWNTTPLTQTVPGLQLVKTTPTAQIFEVTNTSGKIDDAIALYERMFDSERYLALGHVHETQGKLDEAISMYEKAVEVAPENVNGYISLAKAYQARGGVILPHVVDQVLAEYNKALEIEPNSAEAHRALAEFFIGREEWDKVLSEYRKLVELQPDCAEWHYRLGGYGYEKLGMMDEAIGEYQEAIRLNPDVHYYPSLGKAYQKIGLSDQAIATLQEAIRIAPMNQWMHIYLADVYRHNGMLDEAIAEYRAALRIAPENETAKAMLSDLGVLTSEGQ